MLSPFSILINLAQNDLLTKSMFMVFGLDSRSLGQIEKSQSDFKLTKNDPVDKS